MSNVLLIHSSVFGDKSQSLALARDFLKRYPHRSVVERALSAQTMPHLDGETFVAMGTPANEHNSGQQAAVALSDELIGELEAADTIVLAVPMYNFLDPLDPEGLDRSRGAPRPHLSLHREGPRGPAEEQESVRAGRARRRLQQGLPALCRFRLPGAVSQDGARLPWPD